MKRFLLLATLWIVGLCFLLNAAWAQTTNVAVPSVTTTNLPIVIVPLADKIDKWFEMAQNIIIGAGAVLITILGVWAKIKTTQASVVGTLVKTVESHGTPELKNAIEQAALRAGVEPALNAAVKANTTTNVADGLTSDPLPVKPVVNPTNPADINPL